MFDIDVGPIVSTLFNMATVGPLVLAVVLVTFSLLWWLGCVSALQRIARRGLDAVYDGPLARTHIPLDALLVTLLLFTPLAFYPEDNLGL